MVYNSSHFLNSLIGWKFQLKYILEDDLYIVLWNNFLDLECSLTPSPLLKAEASLFKAYNKLVYKTQ